MKRYEMLILEWDLGFSRNAMLKEGYEPKPVARIGAGVGAALGGGVGLLAAGNSYLKKRAALQQQMAECADDNCRMQIKAKLAALRSESIRTGTGKVLGGSLGGAMIGGGVGALDAGLK